MLINRMGMANHLLSSGFKLLKIDRNKADRTRLVFLFEDSDALRNAMSSYNKLKKGNQNDNKRNGDGEME